MKYSRRSSLAIALGFLASAQNKAPQRVDWIQLRGYNYRTGRINADAKSLDGKEVRMTGYMVPFDDDQNKTSEFLLVPHFGQCIHVPPPPPNQIVLVTMKEGKATSIVWDKPVLVTGYIKVGEGDSSPYGKVLYRMQATLVDTNTDI
jgi:hypothetical protein